MRLRHISPWEFHCLVRAASNIRIPIRSRPRGLCSRVPNQMPPGIARHMGAKTPLVGLVQPESPGPPDARQYQPFCGRRMTGKMPDSCKKTEAGGLSRRYRNADEETQILQFRISKMIEIPLQGTPASRDPASALHVLPIQQNTDGLF